MKPIEMWFVRSANIWPTLSLCCTNGTSRFGISPTCIADEVYSVWQSEIWASAVWTTRFSVDISIFQTYDISNTFPHGKFSSTSIIYEDAIDSKRSSSAMTVNSWALEMALSNSCTLRKSHSIVAVHHQRTSLKCWNSIRPMSNTKLRTRRI